MLIKMKINRHNIIKVKVCKAYEKTQQEEAEKYDVINQKPGESECEERSKCFTSMTSVSSNGLGVQFVRNATWWPVAL